MHSVRYRNVTLLQPHNEESFLVSKNGPDTPLSTYRARTPDCFLSGQHVWVLRYLVVIQILHRLTALCRFRRHHCRLRIITAECRYSVIFRFHIDYANSECGAAVFVARCVSRLVDRYHMTINDLQLNELNYAY